MQQAEVSSVFFPGNCRPTISSKPNNCAGSVFVSLTVSKSRCNKTHGRDCDSLEDETHFEGRRISEVQYHLRKVSQSWGSVFTNSWWRELIELKREPDAKTGHWGKEKRLIDECEDVPRGIRRRHHSASALTDRFSGHHWLAGIEQEHHIALKQPVGKKCRP